MSSDDGIIINRKTLKAYHWQGDGVQSGDRPIATGKDLNEVVDNVQGWIEKTGLYPEYGISFTN